MESAIGKNLKAFRDKFELTQDDLAEVLGVTQTAVSGWEARGVQPRDKFILQLCELYNLTEDDFKSAANGLYAQQAQGYFSSLSGFVLPVPTNATAPVLGSIAAGDPIDMTEWEGERYFIHPDVQDKHPNAFYLMIKGDSMDKLFPDGCYALIDPDADPQSGDVLAVNVNGYDATVKRVFFAGDVIVLQPESTNPAHRALSLDSSDPDADRVRIIGKVIWHAMPTTVRY